MRNRKIKLTIRVSSSHTIQLPFNRRWSEMEAQSSQCPRIRRRIGKTRSSSQRKVSERPRRGIYGVSACFPGYAGLRVKDAAFTAYSRPWRRKQAWWHRSGRGSDASRLRRNQRGPSASSRDVGEPRRPVEILVRPIVPAGMLSPPCNSKREIVFKRARARRWRD